MLGFYRVYQQGSYYTWVLNMQEFKIYSGQNHQNNFNIQIFKGKSKQKREKQKK